MGSSTALQKSLGILTLLLFLSVGGCLGNQPPCAGMVIDSAVAGSQFVYDAAATNVDFMSTGDLIMDWRAIAGPDAEQEFLVFRNGTEMIVSIAETPAPRVDRAGQLVEALQVTYWAKDPRYDRPGDFAGEWIDVATGRSIQADMRNWYWYESGLVQHQTWFGKQDRPPLLLAPMVWNRPLHTGDTFTLRIAAETFLPEPKERQDEKSALRLEVISIREKEGVCHALLAGSFADPLVPPLGRYVHHFTIEFSSKVALPIHYKTSYEFKQDSGSTQKEMDLVLRSWKTGAGRALATFQEEKGPAPRLQQEAMVGGFLPDRDIGYATTFDEAVNAARNDSSAAQWFSEHPTGVPVHVAHAQTVSSSFDVPVPSGALQAGDNWKIVWSDRPNTGFMTSITRQEWASGILPATFWVESSMVNGDAAPRSLPSPGILVPSLRSLESASALLFQESLMDFTCRLDESSCSFGKDDSSEAAQVTLGSGLLVWLEAGWILQESSQDPDPIAPPVPFT